MAKKYDKDPDATLDYTVDWSAWLGTDVIDSASWNVPDDLVNEHDSNTTTDATVWLSGGVAGTSYEVTNHIETDGGRIDERTIIIRVRQR